MRTNRASPFSGDALAFLLAGAVAATWVSLRTLSFNQASLPSCSKRAFRFPLDSLTTSTDYEDRESLAPPQPR